MFCWRCLIPQVAAEFIAIDPVSEDFLDELDGEGRALPTLSMRHSGAVPGSFPQVERLKVPQELDLAHLRFRCFIEKCKAFFP